MRLEERLREGFERNGSAIRPDVELVLKTVVVAARRHTRIRHSVAVLSVVLSAIAVAVLAPRGLSFLRGNAVRPPAHTGVVVPTPSRKPAPSRNPDPLVGTWRAARTCDEENAALERVGLTNIAARLNVRCSGPSTVTAIFRYGGVTLDKPDGGLAGTYQVIDAHNFIVGQYVQMGGMYFRYRFTVRGNTLTVHLEKDDYPVPIPRPNDQMAALVAQTIAWNSAPFHRGGDG